MTCSIKRLILTKTYGVVEDHKLIAEYVDHHRKRVEMSIKMFSKYFKRNGVMYNVGASSADLLISEFCNNNSMKMFDIIPNKTFIQGANNYKLSGYIILDLTNPNMESPNEKCDLLVMMEVLEHLLVEDTVVLKNVKKLIKDDGVIFITVPNAVELFTRIKFLLGKNVFWSKKDILHGVFGGYGHIREYTLAELKELLENDDFSIMKMSAINGYRHKYTRIFNFLPASFGNTLAVVARAK